MSIKQRLLRGQTRKQPSLKQTLFCDTALHSLRVLVDQITLATYYL